MKVMRRKNAKKEMKGYVARTCFVCGKEIRVIHYSDKTYRGGHYFGKIPVCSKKEWKKAIAAGTHISKLEDMTTQVLNKDPKPYKHVEYWECPKCYWGKK